MREGISETRGISALCVCVCRRQSSRGRRIWPELGMPGLACSAQLRHAAPPQISVLVAPSLVQTLALRANFWPEMLGECGALLMELALQPGIGRAPRILGGVLS